MPCTFPSDVTCLRRANARRVLAVPNVKRNSDDLLSKEWPVVMGTVQSAQVVAPRRGTIYSPRIVYQYVVDGSVYSSTELGRGATGRKLCSESVSSLAWANCIVDHYSLGTPVQVHYDPRLPHTAMLYPDSEGGEFFTLISAAVLLTGLLLVCAATVILLPRRQGRLTASNTAS